MVIAQKPILSIIIVTWNTAEITQKCISTINKFLSSKLSYEIIVADNGSTDNTSKAIPTLPNVIYFNTGSNLGFSKGCNLAAAKAQGQYLLFLNSDMELVDDSIVSMLEFMKSHPNIGLIGPKFLNPDLTDQGSVFPPQTPLNAFKEFWLGQSAYSKYTPTQTKPVSVWAVSGGAMLITHKLFKILGGWDETYFMFFEDLELCRNIHKLFLDIYYYPGCRVIHRHGASGKNVASSQNQWRRLIPSSIQFHGWLGHHFINSIIWSGQKFQKLKNVIQNFFN